MKKVLFLLAILPLVYFGYSTHVSTNSVKKIPTIPVAPYNNQYLNNISTFKQVKHIQLNGKQIVYLTGEVNTNVDDIIEQIDKLNKFNLFSEIYLLIDSPGGSVSDGAKLISAMEASAKPIITVCTGMCASMGAIIHQYGSTRMMLDRSFLMFHDASGGLQGTIPQMRSRLNYIDRMTTKMDAFIAKRANTDLAIFLDLIQRELWLDAEDSTNTKFNDQIVSLSIEEGHVKEPTISFEINVETPDQPNQPPKHSRDRIFEFENK